MSRVGGPGGDAGEGQQLDLAGGEVAAAFADHEAEAAAGGDEVGGLHGAQGGLDAGGVGGELGLAEADVLRNVVVEQEDVLLDHQHVAAQGVGDDVADLDGRRRACAAARCRRSRRRCG